MPRSISHQQGRINLCDLKSQIAKQLGPDRTQTYFGCLTRLLARKLTKTEFDKFCFLVLGRENIPLHNKLIRSILKNAYEAKTPPVEKIASSQIGAFTKKSFYGNVPSNRLQNISPSSLIQGNGNILPPSPRNKMTQKSLVGLNGKVDVHAQQSCLPTDNIAIKENGTFSPGWKRPRQHYQSGLAEQPAKLRRHENSFLHDNISLRRKVLLETVKVADTTTTTTTSLYSSSPGPITRHLQAPLGIPFHPSRVGGRRKSLLSASSSTSVISNSESGELCHTEGLQKLMEKVAEAPGIDVTLHCANLLNSALDTYLKRLIKSTVEVARISSMQEPTNIQCFKQRVNERPLNGIWAGNHMPVQNSVESLSANNGHRNQFKISLRDFQVAMEQNPQQLGGNWPLLLEKVCNQSYEE